MQSAAIAIVAALAGIFLVVMVGGMATLIVLHLRAQKSQVETKAALERFQMDLDNALTTYQSEMTQLIEGARASFTGIRQEIKASQNDQMMQLGKVLAELQVSFKREVDRINGTRLEAAAVGVIKAAHQIAATAQIIQSLVVSQEAVPGASDLAPEEYGSDDTIYARMSESAKMDMREQQAEVEAGAPLFSQGMPG